MAHKYKISGVYKIVNKKNGKLYIGSAVNFSQRKNQHKNLLIKNNHHSPYLQRAWNKYGEESFEFILIEEVLREDLIIREQYYIDTLKPEYNIAITAGSMLGYKHTPETKKLMSDIKKSKPTPLSAYLALEKAHKNNKGKKYSKERVEKSISNRKRTYKNHSEETKAKLKANHISKTNPERWEEIKKYSSMINTKPKKIKTPRNKLTLEMVNEIKAVMWSISPTKIAAKYNVSPQLICGIKYKRTWK